eukprot:6174174-Pleurochrysis_carterae.AAC.2
MEAQALAQLVQIGTERDGAKKVSLGTAVGVTCQVMACESLPAQSPSKRLMLSNCARCSSHRAAVKQARQRGHGQMVLVLGNAGDAEAHTVKSSLSFG